MSLFHASTAQESVCLVLFSWMKDENGAHYLLCNLLDSCILDLFFQDAPFLVGHHLSHLGHLQFLKVTQN